MDSKNLLQRNLGLSAMGQEIQGFFYHKPQNRHNLLFIGGVHGDEPEGVWLAEELILWAEAYLKNTSDFAANFLIIPCLNPDGFSIYSRCNGRGVDLNRNFPTKDWQTNQVKNRYYPGSLAASEPETQLLIHLIKQIQPSLIMHFHSYHEPMLIYSGNKGKATAENFALNRGVQARADIGYPTPGSLGQYGLLDLQIPVICIEEEEGTKREEIFSSYEASFYKLLSLSENLIIY